MVGEGEHVASDFPSLIPSHELFVDQQAHHFSNRNGGVSVVELDDNLLRQLRQGAVELLEATQHILQSGAREEVLLLETELLAYRHA